MALKEFSASLSLSKGCTFLCATMSRQGQGFDKLSQSGLISPLLVRN